MLSGPGAPEAGAIEGTGLRSITGAGTASILSAAGGATCLDVTRQNDGGIEFTWEIMPGHYLYRERISATTDGGKLLPVATAAGEKKEDPTFGMTEVYHEKAQAGIDVGNLPPTGAIHVSYQGCAEHGVCYPPVSKRIDLATLAVSPDKRERRDDISASIGRPVTEPVQPDLGFSATLAGGLPTMLLTFLGGACCWR